jgi:hypothetical protein
VRELQNLVLNSVLFCDAAEVDVGDLHISAKPAVMAADGPRPFPAPARAQNSGESDTPGAADPSTRLRQALAAEIAVVLQAGPKALVPIGKWLLADLILTADRLSGGISRRGAELLGLPETTYRRRLQAATRDVAAGLAVRSPRWRLVVSLLEDVIRGRQGETDVCEWAEACLLAEIESAVPDDARIAAALLGVTEPTLRRRQAERRHF